MFSSYFGKLNRKIIEQIRYRNTIVVGVVTADNGDGTYDVRISQADVAYPKIETLDYNAVYSVGEIVDIIFEYSNKESPKIIGHSKKIMQEPIEVEVDYSGGFGDPITTVTTLDAYLKISSSAYLEGKIELSNGAGNCTRRGFRYGLTIAYGSDVHEDGSYGTGYYNKQIIELDPETTYHFQAYVIDDKGDEKVGEDKIFTTTSPVGIDIGSAAINRDTETETGYTWILKDNPANATGKIKKVEIYAHPIGLENCEVAIFYLVAENTFSTRDYVTIGAVIGGSKQEFEVDLNIQKGDHIGIHFTGGALRMGLSGGGGAWILSSDEIPCSERVFGTATQSDMILSLYGIGEG